jgi:hypothetical protein
MQKKYKLKVLICLILLIMIRQQNAAQIASATVNLSSVINHNSKLLLGITMDSRSGMTGYSNTPIGYFNVDTTGTLNSAIQPLFGNFPFSTVRYPGNAISVAFEWKKTVGHPAINRPTINVLGPSGPVQKNFFGFDEFMKMTEQKGLTGKDVQLMVPIYTIGTPDLTPTQTLAAITNPVRNNADWVEYANAPNNGSNPGGGTDWAAMRAVNGHPQPYDIKIWNIGNEPWAPGEYNFNATNYLTLIAPIVDSMRAIDPTIKITLPAIGSATTAWNSAILNSTLVSTGKIYGLSPHFFPDELTPPSPPANGVLSRENALVNLSNAALSKGLKIIVGDHAHGIPGAMSPDLAMQWQGANLTADFLLMISQLPNVERANFWIYGIPTAVWHPIRQNSPGNFSLLAVGELYKLLFPLFLDKSLLTNCSSPQASDNNPYSIRTGAFTSSDNSMLNVIAVNRDKTNAIPLSLVSPAGYTLQLATTYNAASLSADNYTSTATTTNTAGQLILPAMSISVLQYIAVTTAITKNKERASEITVLPNPADNFLILRLGAEIKPIDEICLYDVAGNEVFRKQGFIGYEAILETTDLEAGIYMLLIRGKGEYRPVKILIQHP